MALGVYPETKCFYEEFNTQDNVIKARFENGYESSRPRWSKGLQTFKLRYDLINRADMEELNEFFNTQRGSHQSFSWFHPRKNEWITCKFMSDEFPVAIVVYPGDPIDPTSQANARFNLTVELREVF